MNACGWFVHSESAAGSTEGTYFVRSRVFGEADIAVHAEYLQVRGVSLGWIACVVSRTMSLTGSSGIVSSTSTSFSVSLSTNENQSFSDCLKSRSFPAQQSALPSHRQCLRGQYQVHQSMTGLSLQEQMTATTNAMQNYVRASNR